MDEAAKWVLVWVVGGTVTALSLPDAQEFASEEACQAAAEVLRDFSGRQAMRGTSVSVEAGCIAVEDS